MDNVAPSLRRPAGAVAALAAVAGLILTGCSTAQLRLIRRLGFRRSSKAAGSSSSG